MSSSNSSDDAILVNQETTVMVGHGDDVSGGLEIHVHSPSTTGESGEMENQMLQYNRPKTFRKLSNSSSIISEIFRHPNTSEDRIRVKIKRANDRDNSKELIEFLRTTSPPPQNRMSIVENHVQLPREKTRLPFWAICKRFKARKAKQKAKMKSAPAPPPLLILPDSAVAGRTVDGHRHIAISIPVEYDHLGNEVDSGVPARTLASPLIGMDRVPARVSSARSNTTGSNPTKETGAPGDGLPSLRKTNCLGTLSPDNMGNIRPRTAEPIAAQRSPLGVSGTPRDDLDTGMHQPVHKHSFGYSSIGIHESPDGVSVRRHHHWSWPADSKLGREHASTSESMVMNGTEATLANAMAVRGYSPRLSMTGADRYPSLSELRRGQSMLTFPDMGMVLTSDLRPQKSTAQMSYHEVINHGPDSSGSENGDMPKTAQTMRSLTFDLPPGYPFPLRPGMHTPITTAEPQVKEPLHLTPVMTVVDVKPCLSMKSLCPSSNKVSTPQPTRVATASDSSSPESSSEDGEITPKATPGRQPIHNPSIEQLLFTRNPHLVDIVSPSRNIRPSTIPLSYPRSPMTDYKQAQRERRVPRSDSHQALAQRYQELRHTRDQEMDILLNRLERLENKNDWWLNSVVPMVENMTRRLTRVYDDDSLPRLTHERAQTRRQNRSSSFSDMDDITTTTPKRTFSSSTAIRTPLNNPSTNTRTIYSPSQSYSPPLNFLPSLSTQQTVHSPHHNQTPHLEPETSFSSFDSFNFDNPITTSDTPPAREPSPYPYPYIYPGEASEEIYSQGGENETSFASSSSYYHDATSLRHCSFGDDSQQHEMEIPSSWDPGHGGAGYGLGHGMGVAVDRLPSRHGEFGLLNMVGGGGGVPGSLGRNSNQGSYTLPSRARFLDEEDEDESERKLAGRRHVSIPASSKARSTTGSRSRPTSWPSRGQRDMGSRLSGGGGGGGVNYEAEERSVSNYDVESEADDVDEQRQTEWDTLEPLMRGLMETTRLDLELGRDLDLGLTDAA